MNIRVSFCIPTLNFGAYIAETLLSIAAQAGADVEIVVIDGGSTDNTAEEVHRVTRIFPAIRFVQSQTRRGIDHDILRSVEEARGEYCWLFSSDDILAPGALARAFDAIAIGGWDVLVVGMTLCDVQMQPQNNHRILSCSQARTFDWSNPRERSEYFRLAHTSTAFFSFISNVLVRRDAWLTDPPVERFVGSCWIIAAKVFGMSTKRLRVRFDPAICVLKRGDNDSFAADGLIRRIALSFRGFRDLGSFFFGEESFEATQISRVVRNEYPFLDVLDLKRRIVTGGSDSTSQDFYQLVRRHYPGSAPWHLCRYLAVRLTPASILSLARPPYLFLRNLVRSFRN